MYVHLVVCTHMLHTQHTVYATHTHTTHGTTLYAQHNTLYIQHCVRNSHTANNTLYTKQEKLHQEAVDDKRKEAEQVQQPDELIDFVHLKNKRGLSALEIDDEITSDLQRATGMVRVVCKKMVCVFGVCVL